MTSKNRRVILITAAGTAASLIITEWGNGAMKVGITVGVIVLLRVIQSIFGKQVSLYFPQTRCGRMKYLAISMGLSAVLGLAVFALNADGAVTVPMLLISGTSGLALACCTVCGKLAMQSGTMALESVVAAASVILPSVCGVLFWGEPMSAGQWIGIVLFLGSVLLMVQSSQRTNAGFSGRTLLLLLGTFLSNGAVMICQKLITFAAPGSSIALFSFFMFAIPALLCAGIAAGTAAGTTGERLDQRLVLPIVLLAAAVFVINQLATGATDTVPSVMLFAALSASSSVIAAIVGAVGYGERLTVRSVCGIVLCVASLAMINLL